MDTVSDDATPSKWMASGAGVRPPAARLGIAVVRQIVDSIVTGEFAAGETLPPEGTLSAHFGVSRTVIRESVKRIEEKGLVTVAQGRGTTVNSASSWNVLDTVVISSLIDHDNTLGVLDELAVVRGSLEASMAGAAARLHDESTVENLRIPMAKMESTFDDIEAFKQADADFHFAVMEQSQIRLAASITRILFDRARESSRFVGAPGEASRRETLAEHQAVLAAIESGDANAASHAMATHIEQAWARRRPRAAKQ